MWDEPLDQNLIGKVDMVIMCHTLEDTIALSEILRSHDVVWPDGRTLPYDLCWGHYHPGKDPIAYRVDRYGYFGWASYEFYEDPDGEYGDYRRMTFHADDNLPELDVPGGTEDFLLI